MNIYGHWIIPTESMGDAVPKYEKRFNLKNKKKDNKDNKDNNNNDKSEIKKAELYITALGTYEANLNGKRVGDFIMAPGFTAYDKRLQVQCYDITNLISDENTLSVLVGKGWYRSPLCGWLDPAPNKDKLHLPAGLIAWIKIIYKDGSTETISTDESWTAEESQIRFSELYGGEICDATYIGKKGSVSIYKGPTETLIEQEGTFVREQEIVYPAKLMHTPKGELVIDFGQNLTGYVRCFLEAREGDRVNLSFAEVLDKDGNFYNENYRKAKCIYEYTCREGKQTYQPRLTFWGFRYIRVNEFPGGLEKVTMDAFEAAVIYSDMKRTGFLKCSDPLLNKLFTNIDWGQKGNFVDVPTDCPQRDERLGWTGDAQVFCRTAMLNYDCEQFFEKWLADLSADQHEDGYVGFVIPDVMHSPYPSAAWGDAAAVCPWELYLAYGNKKLLARQYDSMCKWVQYINTHSSKKDLWTGGEHCGDWLGLDAPSGSYKGSSREDFIASAFFAFSTSLVIKAGKALGKDVSAYEVLYARIVKAFQNEFPEYYTQTECVLAVHFGLARNPQAAADKLAEMIRSSGNQMQTGFVGTPYLLHALSSYGYAELAYSLLLRREYPSWLYSVTKGATTIWEHWDGKMPDGSFWSADMNSFNHYAYGAVADWVYSFAAGIMRREDAPGYEKITVAPHPDRRLDWLEARLNTRHGTIVSRWEKQDDLWRFDIETPVEAEIIIGDIRRNCGPGKYTYSYFS